jgi:hypothetical protein
MQGKARKGKLNGPPVSRHRCRDFVFSFFWLGLPQGQNRVQRKTQRLATTIPPAYFYKWNYQLRKKASIIVPMNQISPEMKSMMKPDRGSIKKNIMTPAIRVKIQNKKSQYRITYFLL